MGYESMLDSLAELQDDEARASFFGKHPELSSSDLVTRLCVEITRLLGVDLDKARALTGTVCWLAADLDDDSSRAQCDRARANVMHTLGESARAQELYEAAIDRFLGVGDEVEAASTRSSALNNLAFLGEYQVAIEWHQLARQAFEHHDDRRRLAVLEHNFGILLGRRDRWEEALESYSFAYREFYELEGHQDAAICMRNIAVCYIHLHQFTEALRIYERSRAYCKQHGLTRFLLQVDYNIAYLYYLRGEYTRAIRLYRQVRQDCEAAGDEYHKALCDLDQAEMFLDLNLVEETADLAQSAFDTFEQLKIPYEMAKALTNQAVALSRQGRGGRALALLSSAREIFLAEKNRLWPALIDFYRAVVHYRERRPGEAEGLARSALATFSEAALAPRAAMCEAFLARLLLALGRPREARAVCHEALGRLAVHDLPAIEHQVYLVIGQVEEEVGDPQAALTAYRRSHRWLEKLRGQLRGEDLRIAFLEDKLAIYESLVWLTLQDDPGDAAKRAAFEYIESAKSRNLADLLAFRANALEPRSSARRELANRVRSLREELNWLHRRVDQETMRDGLRSRDEVRGLEASIRDKEDELLRFWRDLQMSDRELTSLQAGTVIDLDTIRPSLPTDATLLEYFIARGQIFVCVLDREQLKIVPLADAAAIRKVHRFLQFQLSMVARVSSAGAASKLSDEATRAHLRELYDALIGPIRPLLDCRELIIVPHGFLHYVPFHALYDGSADLVEQFSISYAPSAGVYHLCSSKTVAFEDSSLVLGVADDRAPHILEEAKVVADSLPRPTLLLGEEASEDALRRHGSKSRFLHLATHGFFRRENPMFSAIQLGTSRLSLFDLYDLELNAELVVLSGCATGLNAVMGADELIGLTRGLLYAGAQCVLVTLWDVHDASTAVFMRRFYENLTAEPQVAAALRKTMLEFRQDYPHPYFWAPFILVGKPQESKLQEPLGGSLRPADAR